MKRLFVGAAVICVLLATGCGDETTTLTPGDPADPAFQLFTEQFSGIDETTGLMTDATLEIIGDFFPEKPGGPFQTAASFTYSLEYIEAEGHWLAQADIDIPESGVTVSLSETIQFLVDGAATQYPTLETLDQARCTGTMNVTGPNIETASGTQTLVIVPQLLETEVLVTVNGSGSLETVFTNTEETPGGTRTCDVAAAFTSTIHDVRLSSATECPSGGFMSYSGNVDVACTGANPGTVAGHWTVTTRFNTDATATVTVVSGGNMWETTTQCGTPAS